MVENKPNIMGALDGSMKTRSGKKLDILNPQPDQIDILDIAAGLAYKPHFSGQTPKFFSIAQHSIMVTDAIFFDLKRIALLHDASEAYLGDIIKPLKVMLPEFQRIEKNLMFVIFQKFNLDIDLLNDIKQADKSVQEVEYAAFYNGVRTFDFWDPDSAYRTFLNYYNRLF